MEIRKRLLLILLLWSTLACQTVTRLLEPELTPSPTLAATFLLEPTSTTAFGPTPPTVSPSPFLPSATPSPTNQATPRPTTSPLQKKVFEELWRVVNEDYLYRDFNGLDWNAIHEEYRQKVDAGLSDEDFYAAMEEMIARLSDDHSIYLNPQTAKEEDAEYAGDYDYVGIGIITEVVPERLRVTIILVFPGSPAEEAGLQIHDSILAVDGQPIVAENGYRRNLLRGPDGSKSVLTIYTPGQGDRQVTVTRRRITSNLPLPYSLFTSTEGKRIGYILLTTFNDVKVSGQVKDALKELSVKARLDGLILDNRENSGGSSDVFGDTLAYFTNGTVGYFINRQGEEALQVSGKDIGGSQKIPLVVLVGQGTASFGEIFSGILQDIGRAYVIGQTTDGNVEILYTYEFEDGSRAWIAHDTFHPLKHPDQNWEEAGIVPDKIVLSNWDEITIDNDPVVQAALNYFDHRVK